MNEHILNDKEWQDYCVYKAIKPQIKGCLDRERELEKKLAEKDNHIKQIIKFYSNEFVEKDKELKKLRFIVKLNQSLRNGN